MGRRWRPIIYFLPGPSGRRYSRKDGSGINAVSLATRLNHSTILYLLPFFFVLGGIQACTARQPLATAEKLQESQSYAVWYPIESLFDPIGGSERVRYDHMEQQLRDLEPIALIPEKIDKRAVRVAP